MMLLATLFDTCVAGSALSAGAADYFDIYSANDELHYRVWFDVGNASAAPAGGAGITLLEVDVTATDTAEQVASKLTDELNTLDEFSASYSSEVVTVVNTGEGTSTDPTENVTDAGFSISIPSGKTGAGEDTSTNRFVGISNADTPAQAVDDTARSLVRVINAQADSPVIASYTSGPSDVPGAIMIEAKQLGTNAIAFVVSDTTIGAKFNPTLPAVAFASSTVTSDNEVNPNRIYYSKYQQPEAVPIVNYLDVGPKDEEILRIVPLRDSLFILKEDGVYRLSGERGSFTVTLFDNSTKLKAADTASVLNNQIYMFSDQGIVTVSDTGISVISRPIENELLPLTGMSAFSTASFSVSYESDRAFLLWTVDASSDTTATQCFRYNTFTSIWTKWDSGKVCAVVNSGNDKLYLGANDTNYIEEERKSHSRLDYADREVSLTLPADGLDSTTLLLGGTFGMEVGDVIVQTQYLTIAQFNRLLRKLDDDYGVADSDYYSTLVAEAGDRLSSKLTSLVAKLNADSGVADADYTSSGSDAFATLQTDYNTITAKLNADAGVGFSNYPTSSGTVEYEARISAVNTYTNRITLELTTPFIYGAMTGYKHIESTVVWGPQHFGDPSITKQVREATLMFEDSQFNDANVYYSSDLSTGFVRIPFEGEGSGTFGGGVFGDTTWGGEGTSKPLRTLIPLEKQRCRFINCKFNHKGAFEKYAIFGISFTFETTSPRGYR